MKILMTALQPSGGIRTFFRYVYGQDVFNDCEFVLLAPDEGLGDFLSEFIPRGRINLIPSSRDPQKYLRLVRRVVKSGSFDLIHSHGFSAGVLTQLASTGLGVPHLLTAHDVFTAPQFYGWKGQVKKVLLGMAFARIPAIHTVTEDAKQNLLQYFPSVKCERVRSILHGVDTEFFRAGVPRLLKGELSLSQEVPLIGFFGRFMGQKGFKILVDALEIIKNEGRLPVVPHVVTFAAGGYIREDYSYLEGKGLAQYFHRLQPTDDMPSALKGVDLVVMPSRWEACGLLAMESLAAGVPIVGTDCVGLREVIEGSPARAAKAGDSASLASAISEELEALDSRKRVFQDFQPIAVERFKIVHPANELHRLYRKLI